jgi:hypothetical protein
MRGFSLFVQIAHFSDSSRTSWVWTCSDNSSCLCGVGPYIRRRPHVSPYPWRGSIKSCWTSLVNKETLWADYQCWWECFDWRSVYIFSSWSTLFFIGKRKRSLRIAYIAKGLFVVSAAWNIVGIVIWPFWRFAWLFASRAIGSPNVFIFRLHFSLEF